MTQRTYYPPATSTPATPTTPVEEITSSDPTHLRHGYTLAALDGIARCAVHSTGPMGMDWHDRYDTAWSAAAEHLYAATEAPHPGDLTHAGQRAIYATVRAEVHHHGHYTGRAAADRGYGTSPAFAAYWSSAPSGFEPALIERLTLPAVLDALPDRAQQVLRAVAALGDQAALGPVLGVPAQRARRWLREARAAALALWHEHETPPTTPTIRGRRRTSAPCGTRGGYARHRYHRESACQPCRDANNDATKAWNARRALADGVGLGKTHESPPKHTARASTCMETSA